MFCLLVVQKQKYYYHSCYTFSKMHLSYQPLHYTRNTTTIQNLSNTEREVLGNSFSSQKVTLKLEG